jgi:hypothetical protein
VQFAVNAFLEKKNGQHPFVVPVPDGNLERILRLIIQGKERTQIKKNIYLSNKHLSR